jgi:transposase
VMISSGPMEGTNNKIKTMKGPVRNIVST